MWCISEMNSSVLINLIRYISLSMHHISLVDFQESKGFDEAKWSNLNTNVWLKICQVDLCLIKCNLLPIMRSTNTLSICLFRHWVRLNLQYKTSLSQVFWKLAHYVVWPLMRNTNEQCKLHEQCHTYELVIPHVWMSHDTQQNREAFTCSYTLFHLESRKNELHKDELPDYVLYHTKECVMSHAKCLSTSHLPASEVNSICECLAPNYFIKLRTAFQRFGLQRQPGSFANVTSVAR